MKHLNFFSSLIDESRLRFQWRYWRGQTPWDTNVTPPEVLAFIETNPPGKAIDLGCGTGTNAITLARNRWGVVGVDFAGKAIRKARRKTAASGMKIDFHIADVTDLGMLTKPFDYALDIGCLFTLKPQNRIKYAKTLARLLRPAGWYMLYAWMPRTWNGRRIGISQAEVEALLGATFVKEKVAIGEEKGHPSAWYWFRRR